MSLRFDIGKSFFYSALYTTLFQSSLAEEENSNNKQGNWIEFECELYLVITSSM